MSKIQDKYDRLTLDQQLSQLGPSIGDLILNEADMADRIYDYASKNNIVLIAGSNKNVIYIKNGRLTMQVMIRKKREEVSIPHQSPTGPILVTIC